jgi:hypothetical protein
MQIFIKKNLISKKTLNKFCIPKKICIFAANFVGGLPHTLNI